MLVCWPTHTNLPRNPLKQILLHESTTVCPYLSILCDSMWNEIIFHSFECISLPQHTIYLSTFAMNIDYSIWYETCRVDKMIKCCRTSWCFECFGICFDFWITLITEYTVRTTEWWRISLFLYLSFSPYQRFNMKSFQ